MPQELHIGHRSRLVSSIAWMLMLLALSALGLLAWRSGYVRTALDTLVLSLPACGALLLLAVGQALLRRYEWGRKLALGLLLLAILLLPTLSAVFGGWVPLALAMAVSATLVWPLRALGRPSIKREFA
jgi:hypothetical protein